MTDTEKLTSVRNELLPGCWCLRPDKDVELDIWCDFPHGRLALKVYRLSTNKMATDYITLRAINDGAYKVNFSSKMTRLLEEVN